jgi:hypothetical protein
VHIGLRLEVPGFSGVAAFADRKIITTESSLAVVTTHATH